MLALFLAAEETLSQIELDAMLVVVVVSFIIPTITGLITKVSAPPYVKQIVTLALAAANGLITTGLTQDGTAVISKEAFLMALLSLAIAVSTYLGIYKPNDANQKLLSDQGLG